MAVHVDLSAPELKPNAVLAFVRGHTSERPSQNILFEVSAAVFRLYKQGLTDVVAVSSEEAAELNAALGASSPADDYLISGSGWRCSNCGRYLNFYDVFQSGKNQHDNDFFKVFLGGDDYHLQVARENAQLDVECTNCGTTNVMKAPVHYTGSTYGYV